MGVPTRVENIKGANFLNTAEATDMVDVILRIHNPQTAPKDL